MNCVAGLMNTWEDTHLKDGVDITNDSKSEYHTAGILRCKRLGVTDVITCLPHGKGRA